MKNLLVTLLLLLVIPISAQAADSPALRAKDLTSDQVKVITHISEEIETVHQLVARGTITAAQEQKADADYCAEAKKVVGQDVTPAQVQALAAEAAKTKGFSVFKTILVVVGGFIVIAGVIALLGYYLRPILAAIPVEVYEALAYIATGALAVAGLYLKPFDIGAITFEPIWLSIPGALALAGCISLTKFLHFKGSNKGGSSYMGPGFINYPTILSGICTVAWGALAVSYHSAFPASGIPYVLAFGAVMALQSFMGFSAISMPGALLLGWEEEKQIPQSVFASFIILVVYTWMKLTGGLIGTAALFESGAFFMGAFVYFLGLLILSSKWVSGRKSGGNYGLLQVVTIVSGFAALYLGSTYHLGALLGVGGTFFALYLLEKYYEFPWKGVGWLWSLVGFGLGIWYFVGFATKHPQYFIWGIH